MAKYYRLTQRAQMHGEVRDPGYLFTLEDGEVGPCKTVPADAPNSQLADHMGGFDGRMVDEPLYVEVPEEQQAAIEEKEAEIIREADAHAEASQAHAEGKLAETPADEPAAAESKPAGDVLDVGSGVKANEPAADASSGAAPAHDDKKPA